MGDPQAQAAHYARLAEEKANAVQAKLGMGSAEGASTSNTTAARRSSAISTMTSRVVQRANTVFGGKPNGFVAAPVKEVRIDERLTDPDFLENVKHLMRDPRIAETFAVFDKDGSGSITTSELREVITMLQLASNKTDLEEMLDELDINKDGGIDLWEFCVYLQKSRERKANEESNWELDQAFQLFTTDANGCIDVAELKRIMTSQISGMPLTPVEWAEMCEHMGLSEVENTRISLAELRAHECWQHQRVGEGVGGSPKR